MSEELLEKNKNRDKFVEQNDDEHFPSEEESSAYTSGSDEDVEMEDINARLQILRFQGRPSTILRGKMVFCGIRNFLLEDQRSKKRSKKNRDRKSRKGCSICHRL